MSDNKEKENMSMLTRFVSNMRAMVYIFVNEIRNIFKDRGVVILFLLATIAYPLLYNGLYLNESVTDVPIAIVDDSHTATSADFIRRLDATSYVKVAMRATDMAEAEKSFKKRDIHGIVYIPKDFSTNLNKGIQAKVSAYSDMSSFMYYRSMTMATNYVSLNMGKEIQMDRLLAQGYTNEQALMSIDPIPYDNVILYNPGMGYSSFLLPAVLILIIHQTLFFGIGMAAGTARGDNKFHELVAPSLHRGGLYRVVFGKGLAYFSLYLLLSVYILGVIPKLFNLPHFGNVLTLLEFVVPFILATVFFSMSLSVFNPHRETQMVLFLFFSVILLFLSGVSWPMSNISPFWRVFGSIFPSTYGIQGYVKINSMGAKGAQIRPEIIALWVQTAGYFLLTVITYRWQIKQSEKKQSAK